LSALTIGKHNWGDLYGRAFYRLGQIAEKQGKPVEAAGHYRAFLDLWKNADPGLPEPADARSRLERIVD
jgi:hypothetical protein